MAAVVARSDGADHGCGRWRCAQPVAAAGWPTTQPRRRRTHRREPAGQPQDSDPPAADWLRGGFSISGPRPSPPFKRAWGCPAGGRDDLPGWPAVGCGFRSAFWPWAHRTRSRPGDDDALTARSISCSELGCRRPVELRESDDLVTAATVGSLRPCILLPRDWASWTAEHASPSWPTSWPTFAATTFWRCWPGSLAWCFTSTTPCSTG